MKKIRVIRPSKGPRLSFKGVEEVALPQQSMTLQEILKRFSRRESLPIARQGFYEDRFGDLEKEARLDISEMDRKAKEFKALGKRLEREAKEKVEAEWKKKVADEAEAAAKAASEKLPPAGNVTDPVK